VISAGAHQPKMHDLETGALRDTTLQDLQDLVKIGDALDTVGSAPCVPLDQPIHLQEIQMHKVAWENSRRRANDMFEHDPKPNVNVAQYVYEMSQAAGRWFSLGIPVSISKKLHAMAENSVASFLGVAALGAFPARL